MEGKRSMSRIYPDSHVEIQGLLARNYDSIMNLGTFGSYDRFIKAAIKAMDIQSGENILDLGCGTGRNACLMHAYLGDRGSITGMDISEAMGDQFKKKCAAFNNVIFKNQRVDIPFTDGKHFNTVFMSFVLHGFPHEVRLNVLHNIFGSLKPGGRFCLLDFSEFRLKNMPLYHRWAFQTFECKYAFDFVERDWKKILTEAGFADFREQFWFKNYVRLLIAKKSDGYNE
jgi:demethylmenaquinone methyltransferase/2-methoxy-6-polyprenyl-1,4-benzoquinol methylase